MGKPIKTITKAVTVGIYDCSYVARIYADKIVVTTPYLHWANNSGSIKESKAAIRDRKALDLILADISHGREREAWSMIGAWISDEWLTCY